ncbi:MAG: DNA helicase UvrBC [Peptococcaceae bacterium]|nr:DNA helicase UvrBC [Peptococcaceae bacterium]
MLCQNCLQREATVHLTKIINGQGMQMHLCQECAQKVQGFGFNFNIYPGMATHFLQALFGLSSLNQTGQSVSTINQEKCPGCGWTFAQIQHAGRMGCSQCYDKFETQIEPLLRQIHGGGVHVGKVPKRCAASIRNKQELLRLRSRLQELVQREEFEEAARVRDRIKELEKLVGGEE